MKQTLNILIIEDSQADFLLVVRHLQQQGLVAECLRVDSPVELEIALDRNWDLVLSDYSVPELDFMESFARVRSRAPHLPLILVSGSVGEEHAVELLKLGVWDFVLKDNLTRLVPSIQRSLREVEERKARQNAEAALQKSEQRFKSIFNNSPIAIGIGRRDDGTLVEVNEAWLRLYGYQRHEVIGKTTAELGLYARAEERSEMIRLISECGRVLNHEILLRRKNGEIITALYSAELISLGDESYLQVMVTDISEQKRSRQALQESESRRRNLEDQLRQSQKLEAVGQLAGGVAHDFNNLMQIFMGNAQLQAMCNRAHGVDCQYLDEIFKAVERGCSLTRSLLVFSHKQPLKITCFDLNVLIRESLKLGQRLVTEDIEVAVEQQEGQLWLNGDDGLVQQMLFNLLTNARDAIGNNGHIRVRTASVVVDDPFREANGITEPAGTYVLLEVSDDGCGIAEDIRAKIFEPFFTTKGLGKGSGLGLAMIYGTVRQMSGFITLASAEGRGSRFSIHFPLAESCRTTLQGQDHSTEELHGQGELLLITEDDPGVRKAMVQILELYHYRVVQAANADEALRVAGQHAGELRLVVMDIILPGMNGTETLRKLHDRCPGLPALFLSGYSDETLEARGITHHYLRKPVHPVQLLRQVRRVLDQASLPEGELESGALMVGDPLKGSL